MAPDGLHLEAATEKLSDRVFLWSALVGAVCGAVAGIASADALVGRDYAMIVAVLGTLIGCWAFALLGTFLITPVCAALSRSATSPPTPWAGTPTPVHRRHNTARTDLHPTA